MEATKEQESAGLLSKILPPRLEDAGLEDCALPPDSIKEAFLKAASAVKSRATSVFTSDSEDEGTDCVQDPWPDKANESSDDVIGGNPPESAAPDSLVGVESGKEAPGPCVVEKGGGDVEGGDRVVVGGGDVEEREEDNGCVVDGLKGLKIGVGETGGDDVEEEEEGERPILTEGFV
ncbi:uncharacterized protein LOC126682397 [Mercurialis annua]|uniref:uncharacterized protein LOC126682397 n=1 Tax=Mercurialis annua TaxID=3986 RepID=UPI00215EC8A7|nr:uncharacterized protein LOC126682397 [Mercurialis annua]